MGNPKVWYSKFDESTKRQYYEINDYKVKIVGENEPKSDNQDQIINYAQNENPEENNQKLNEANQRMNEYNSSTH